MKGLTMRALLDRWLSSNSKKARGREPTPEGSLAVYVGAARARFVVRTECVNHRLFRALLEEAEEAHGHHFAADGPLELPCESGEFARVVERIEREMDEERRAVVRCGVGMRGHSASAVAHGRQVTAG